MKAIRLKDIEIERLKLELHNEKQYAADWITTYRCEAEELKALMSRAADALEKYTTYPIGMVMSVTLRESGRDIITELRKAAE